MWKESDDFDILRVTFDSRMTLKHLRSAAEHVCPSTHARYLEEVQASISS